MTSSIEFALQVPYKEIKALAGRYHDKKEDAALAAGKRIAGGDYDPARLEPIVRWKSERTMSRVASNARDDVVEALRLATTARAERTRMAVLLGLRGVAVPMASAILAAIDPKRFTIIDFRALETLDARQPDPTLDFYLDYLAYCRKTAALADVSLRDFDRALWQRSSESVSSAR